MNDLDQANPALIAMALAKTGPLLVNEPSFLAAADILSAPAPKRLTATQLLVRQPTYTRSQLLPGNFTQWLVANQLGIFEATTVPLLDLIAMLDRDDHPEGAGFIVVSKCSSKGRSAYVSTVLDLQKKRFFRAVSPTGTVSFWKGVAKRRPQVQALTPNESFEG